MSQALALAHQSDFERFWQAYPRKTAKKEARKAWDHIDPTSDTVDKMIAALHWQQRMPQWVKDGGSFIPHPATWLRAERWDDEPFSPVAPEISDRSRRNIAAARSAVAFIQGRK